MVDCFCSSPPGGGDELQGLKRGIMELADVVVVNKADGDLAPAARRAVADYRHAVHLLRSKHPGWAVPVLAASAHSTASAWTRRGTRSATVGSPAPMALDRLRSAQAVDWLWAELRSGLVDAFRHDEQVAKRLGERWRPRCGPGACPPPRPPTTWRPRRGGPREDEAW